MSADNLGGKDKYPRLPDGKVNWPLYRENVRLTRERLRRDHLLTGSLEEMNPNVVWVPISGIDDPGDNRYVGYDISIPEVSVPVIYAYNCDGCKGWVAGQPDEIRYVEKEAISVPDKIETGDSSDRVDTEAATSEESNNPHSPREIVSIKYCCQHCESMIDLGFDYSGSKVVFDHDTGKFQVV